MAKRKYPKLIIVTLDNAEITEELYRVARKRRAKGKKRAKWGR